MNPSPRLTALSAFDDNYIWMLVDAGNHALVVDPGEAEPVQRVLERDRLTLDAILVTHHHGDHTGGVSALREAHDATVYAPVDDRIGAVDHRVGHGDVITLSRPDLRFDVIGVPGHTRSHIAFFGRGMLFCGDTLFSLGCGRLFEGSPADMVVSLDRLLALPSETLVCCAHEYTLANGAFAQTVDPDNAALGARMDQARAARAAGHPTLPTTLATERATNPFLRIDSPAIKAWAGNDEDTQPARIARFAALRHAKDGFRA